MALTKHPLGIKRLTLFYHYFKNITRKNKIKASFHEEVKRLVSKDKFIEWLKREIKQSEYKREYVSIKVFEDIKTRVENGYFDAESE
jgi:hypothetical protein